MSKLEPDIATIDEGYWRRFVRRAIAPQPKSDVQRGAPRYPYCTEIKLTFEDDGRASTRSLTTLNVSVTGLTAKGTLEIPKDSEVLLELSPEGSPFLVPASTSFDQSQIRRPISQQSASWQELVDGSLWGMYRVPIWTLSKPWFVTGDKF